MTPNPRTSSSVQSHWTPNVPGSLAVQSLSYPVSPVTSRMLSTPIPRFWRDLLLLSLCFKTFHGFLSLGCQA